MNLFARQLFPDPRDPFSFSPPDKPTTATDISLAGPLEAAVELESPLLSVKPMMPIIK
jgi:hypothetical protein